MYRIPAAAFLSVFLCLPSAFAQAPPDIDGGPTAYEDLRQQLRDLVRSKASSLTMDELQRLIAAIEDANVSLPPAAKEVLDTLHKQETDILIPAFRKIITQRRKAVADLKEIQAKLLRNGQLDDALAVRHAARALARPNVKVLADPVRLTGFRGRRGTFYFRVTGTKTGSIWGTRIYTDDTILSTAAVHAGVLRNGQTGIVKVTVLPGQVSFKATTRNGIVSSGYGTYAGSYRVDAPGLLTLQLLPAAKKPPPPKKAAGK